MSTDTDCTSHLSVRGSGEDWHEEVHRGEELPQLHAHLAHVLQVVLRLLTLDHKEMGTLLPAATLGAVWSTGWSENNAAKLRVWFEPRTENAANK